MLRGNTRPIVRLSLVLIPALALLFGLLAARPASAQYPDYGDPRRQQMEAALAQAESDVRRATADADAARSAFDQARAREADLRFRLDRAQEELAAAKDRLAQGETDLPKIRDDHDRAARERDDKRAAFDPIRQRYEAARADYEKARDAALAPLQQNSDAYGTAKANADRARQDVAAAEDESLQALKKTDAYKRTDQAARAADERLQSFRAKTQPAQPNDPALAQAEGDAADAQNRLADLQKQFVDEDPKVKAAREAAAPAQAELDKI
jgi:chromosome segregation ATPase